MIETRIREILDSIKIENRESDVSFGICCNFQVGQESYYADIAADLPWIGTECMIFEKVGDEISWDGVYCRRDIPYSQEALKECIAEFIKSKYAN